MAFLRHLVHSLLFYALASLCQAQEDSADIWLLDIKGAIGPATADYVVRGIRDAQDSAASMVILRIDTPGGLDKSMRQIIQAQLRARIPIVGFVAPGGARAASAGTYILYACHVAVMAPATNLGAATPVQIGSPGLPAMPEDEEPGNESQKQRPSSAMEKKVINDAVAYLQSLADLRGRNRQWAERAVRDGASLAAEQALENKVIDLIARDVAQLKKLLHGRELVLNDKTQILNTIGANTYTHKADWRNEFLSVITDPNVAYILLLLGIYGLIFEFSNPGMGVPGIAGGIALLLALYAFQVLPISYAGLGLILLGISLMIAEAFAPSFGVLGLGGIVAFVIGSIILMDTELPGYQIAWPMIAAFTTFSALLMCVVLGLLIKSRRHAVVSGLQHLQGKTARVETVHDGAAYIRVDGELWQTHCQESLQLNDTVQVEEAEGVILKVQKIKG